MKNHTIHLFKYLSLALVAGFLVAGSPSVYASSSEPTGCDRPGKDPAKACTMKCTTKGMCVTNAQCDEVCAPDNGFQCKKHQDRQAFCTKDNGCDSYKWEAPDGTKGTHTCDNLPKSSVGSASFNSRGASSVAGSPQRR